MKEYTKQDMKKAFEAGKNYIYSRSPEGSTWAQILYPNFGIWLRKYKKQFNKENI